MLNSSLIWDIIICIFLSPESNKERLSLSNGWKPNTLFNDCLNIVLFVNIHLVLLSNLLFHKSMVDGINYLLYVFKRQRICWISFLSVCLVMRELCVWGIRSMRYWGAFLFTMSCNMVNWCMYRLVCRVAHPVSRYSKCVWSMSLRSSDYLRRPHLYIFKLWFQLFGGAIEDNITIFKHRSYKWHF